MSKTFKKRKKIPIEKIEKMATEGKSTDAYFSEPKKMPPREVHKMVAADTVVKVNVDVTESFLHELDSIALFLNISRQAVMKMYLKDGVDRHFLAKQARMMSR